MFWRLEWGCCAAAFRFRFVIDDAEETAVEMVLFLTPTNPVGASIHSVVLLVINLVFVSVFVVVACSHTVLVPNLVSVI